MVTSIIFLVIYGKEITDLDDEYVQIAQLAIEGGSIATTPGAHWIEFLPLLRYLPSWLPGTASKRVAERYSVYVTDMVERPFMEAEAAFVGPRYYSLLAQR